MAADKPPYRIPSMREVRERERHGLVAVSTFSGCGGSSLGLRMAGWRILYANEFIPAARETYRLNAEPETIVDERDVRVVSADSIREAIGTDAIDLLEGSPPCASFSTAGKRSEHWGKVKRYSDGAARVDDLFDEYVRLVRELQPRAFVAENVSGLIKGVAKGYFQHVIRSMRAAGYVVEARVLDAQWLGVPQQRQRLIFVGVRNDLALKPVFPSPLPYRYSLRDALPHIVRIKRSGEWRGAHEPSGAVQASGAKLGVNASFSGGEMVEVEADISRFAIGAEWDKLRPGEASERYFSLVRPHPDAPSPTVTAMGGVSSAAAVTHPTERRKFTIAELKRVCGFPDDFELTGSYQQQWERLGRAVPPPMYAALGSELATLLAPVTRVRSPA